MIHDRGPMSSIEPERWGAIRARLEAELGEAITIDALTSGWKIAQRAAGSCASTSSRIASAIASHSLSGCPSVTDSEVKSVEGVVSGIGAPCEGDSRECSAGRQPSPRPIRCARTAASCRRRTPSLLMM